MRLCDFSLDFSGYVALASALIAILSAFYARRASGEAKRANEISLSSHRNEIYDAFYALKMHMMQRAESAKSDEVSKFYHASRSANLFLPAKIAVQVSQYFDACFWIADINKRNEKLTSDEEAKRLSNLKTAKDLAPEIERSLVDLIKKIST